MEQQVADGDVLLAIRAKLQSKVLSHLGIEARRTNIATKEMDKNMQ
jgi:hypothetical protein